MTVAEIQPLSKLDGPVPFRWTHEDYYNAGGAGIFMNRHVQLLEGEVVEMAPQGAAHVIAVSRVHEALRAAFSTGYWVRAQAPLRLPGASEPEPDVSVVTGSDADYRNGHPGTAILVVEVSDSTLDLDRRRKAKIYAAAGIPEYWIVNLVDRQLEVYRLAADQPSTDYPAPLLLLPADSVWPLAVPGAAIAIARLLP